MLEHLTHYSTVLIANGPRGSYLDARSSPARWKFYHQFEVAFKLARATGMIRDKYFSIEGQVVNFKVSENLVKIQKIASVLEDMRQDGTLLGAKNGRLVFKRSRPGLDREVTRKDIVEALLSKLGQIKGFGEFDQAAVRKQALNKTIWDMLVPEDKVSAFQGAGHFISTWGLYSFLLNRMSIDMAAGRALYQHKAVDAERISYPQNLPDYLCALAESEVRNKDIEQVKTDLQADNPQEIAVMANPHGGELPKYTFVISDVHLREYHHENSDDLLRFIWMVKRLDGKLVINGDFFDVWRAGGLDRAWINNTRIVNALTKLREVVLVAGNHDEFLHKLAYRGGIFANPRIKVVDNYNSDDKTIRILHGHQFDPFNRPGARIGRWVTRAVTRLELPRIRSFLEGTFKSLANFLGVLFGPKLSARLLMVPRLFLPTSYVVSRQLENIMAWLKEEVDLAVNLDNVKLSQDKPVFFIIGHLHYEGISFLSERVRHAVQKEFGGAVKLIITDSWDGGAGYVGDYVVMTGQKPKNELPETIVRKAIWSRESDWRG